MKIKLDEIRCRKYWIIYLLGEKLFNAYKKLHNYKKHVQEVASNSNYNSFAMFYL